MKIMAMIDEEMMSDIWSVDYSCYWHFMYMFVVYDRFKVQFPIRVNIDKVELLC